MHYLRKRLPPLGSLTAFEAAARHLSFTRAADELNLTQAAISRQIKTLEDDLGVRLFERANRRVTLTAEGRQMLHAAAPALAQIANATEQVRTTGGNVRINVATDQSVAALWLAPRLGDFRARHPDIAVRLVVSDNETDCLADANDIAIVHGAGEWPGFDSRILFDETVFPVCSPAFTECFGPITRLADLTALPLIELEDDHWDWISWRVWLTQMGVDRPTEGPRLQINNYPLVLDAAARGEGVALGWRHLADGLIAEGRLIRPLPDCVETDLGYHVALPTARPIEPAVRAFNEWLDQTMPSGAAS